MISERKQQLLKLIIENHIETAEPIGSKFLVSSGDLKVSDATVRNEMRDLENAGFLTHPHTSAGRIPTEEGYKYYVNDLIKRGNISKEVEKQISKINTEITEKISKTKALAKLVAEESKSAVIVAFGSDSVYYTGISNLFSQPEFRNIAHAVSISSIFDHCENTIEELSDAMKKQNTEIFIGSENPLGSDCSVVGVKSEGGNIFAILGPLRMNYKKSITILDYISKVL